MTRVIFLMTRAQDATLVLSAPGDSPQVRIRFSTGAGGMTREHGGIDFPMANL